MSTWTMQVADLGGWNIKRMSGYRISHPFIAVAPACPDGRHPTRDCGCKVHKSVKAAIEYINTKREQDQT